MKKWTIPVALLLSVAFILLPVEIKTIACSPTGGLEILWPKG